MFSIGYLQARIKFPSHTIPEDDHRRRDFNKFLYERSARLQEAEIPFVALNKLPI